MQTGIFIGRTDTEAPVGWPPDAKNGLIEKDMFISALLTIAGTWKQPRCPSTNEWIKKVWYTYTMEYYSAIKRNALREF